MTNVGELCMRDVVVGTAEMTVAEASQLMHRQHVGCVVVVDKMNGGLDVPLGVVTDRDIVLEVTALGLDPGTITIGDIMRGELVTVRADESPLQALQLMRSRGVRRLPVVTESRRLVGLVAFDDLLELTTKELSDLTKVVRREQVRETAERK
ncbi:MAG: CBS domain-containing protein [Burkholderiales bacterium]